MHHKRFKPRVRRAGCVQCKYAKVHGGSALRGPKDLLDRSRVRMRDRAAELDASDQSTDSESSGSAARMHDL
jgi:hypothetical protein